MNVKFRFALLFSLFVFIIQLASVTAIYFLYENFRKEEFTKRLRKESVEKFGNAFKKAVPGQNQQLDLRTSSTLFDEEVVIYDSSFNVVYSYPEKVTTFPDTALLTQIKRKGEKSFADGKRDGLGMRITDDNATYYILASAYDEFGRRKIQNLQYILSFALLGALLLSGLFAFLYVRQVIKPLGELNAQMQRISESNLQERVGVPKRNDELSKTAKTFNAMLDRLQQGFEMRKSFVHHASHELRTPLASMLAQTEAAINKELTTEDAKKVLASLAEDQQDLIDLTNSLLLLSQYEALAFSLDWLPLRVDEILYETIEIFRFQQKQADVSLDFKTFPDDSSYLTIRGNNSLIISAFRNLIKNACLYSDDCHVSIFISADETGITIDFENKGKHIKESERANLFIPFFRAENSVHIKGTGLGLSIVERIIDLHMGKVKYEAVGENINRFTIHFPAQKIPQ
jgi:signal transduction histidine kinase